MVRTSKKNIGITRSRIHNFSIELRYRNESKGDMIFSIFSFFDLRQNVHLPLAFLTLKNFQIFSVILIATQFNILSFFNLTILLYYSISFLFTIKNHSHVYLHVTCVRRMLTSCTCASNTFNVMRLVRLNVNQRQVCRKKD